MKKPEKGGLGGIALLLVLCLYLGGGLAAVTVYGRDGRAADSEESLAEDELRAEEPVEDTVMSETEYEAFMAAYGSATEATETESEAKETESEFDVERLKSALEVSDEAIAEANETVSAAEANRASSYATVSGSDGAASGNDKSESDATTTNGEADTDKSEASSESDSTVKSSESDANATDRKYYSFVVQGIDGLTLHGTKTEHNDTLAEMPLGSGGYVIEEPGTNEKRTLVIYKGKVGYASNMYIAKTEIPAEDYPSELLSISADDAGETIEELKEENP